MKYYVFYVRGECAVTETGTREFDTEQEAREFTAALDVWDSWTMVRGEIVDHANQRIG